MLAQIPYELEEKVHNLCTYPKGIEYASTLEEVETKVTLRQEPYQNK